VPEPVTDKKTGKVKKGQYTCDLVPQPLMIARYFAKEQAKLEELQRRPRGPGASSWRNCWKNTAATRAFWPMPQTRRAR
jgi:hypothetical protein